MAHEHTMLQWDIHCDWWWWLTVDAFRSKKLSQTLVWAWPPLSPLSFMQQVSRQGMREDMV